MQRHFLKIEPQYFVPLERGEKNFEVRINDRNYHEGEKYRFRRVTSAEFSGHHKNEKVVPNPDTTRKTPMYIVKRQEMDNKKRFSLWKYPWKYKKRK